MGNMIGIHQQSGVISAYLATPTNAVQYHGAVIVVHEIWGVTDHIKRVADRFATAGYYALAPDLIFASDDKRTQSIEIQKELFSSDEAERATALPQFRALMASTQTPQFASITLARLEACFEYVYNQPLVHQRVGVVGFGFGGSYAYALAVHEPRLRAAVSFYGHAAYHELELRHITCPVLAFYGEKDSVTLDLRQLKPNMQRAHVNFTPVIYRGVRSAFFNDTIPGIYNSTAANDAWRRTTNFLRSALL